MESNNLKAFETISLVIFSETIKNKKSDDKKKCHLYECFNKNPEKLFEYLCTTPLKEINISILMESCEKPLNNLNFIDKFVDEQNERKDLKLLLNFINNLEAI